MDRIFKYKPKGVCATEMTLVIDNDIIKKVQIVGGCPGNSEGVSRLCVGRNINDVINLLKDVRCGSKISSCPEQLAIALQQYKQSKY